MIDDSHEFKPILVEIQDRPVSPLGRVTYWIIIIFIIIAGLWLYFGKVDVVVSARGKIIPEGEIKILQPLEIGVVKKILVREGEFVKRGQVLMEVDPSTTEPAMESLKQNLEYLNLESQRLEAASEGDNMVTPFIEPPEVAYRPQAVKIQRNLFSSSRQSLINQLMAKKFELKKIDEQAKSAITEKNAAQSILQTNLEQEKRMLAVMDLIAKKDLEDLQAQIKTGQAKIQELEYKLTELQHSKKQVAEEISNIQASFKTEQLKELSDRQVKTTEVQANIKEISFRNKKQQIVSPTDGYVNTLFIHTVGGVVSPAEKLLSIVPVDTPLIIKANVLNKDIGFVRDNMPVSVKIDTFDFQKYGLIKGKVKQVSKDSIEDEKLGPIYEVYITPLNRSLLVEGKEINISTGMSLTAEIKVDKRRIIEFFIYPVVKYWNEGISVR